MRSSTTTLSEYLGLNAYVDHLRSEKRYDFFEVVRHLEERGLNVEALLDELTVIRFKTNKGGAIDNIVALLFSEKGNLGIASYAGRFFILDKDGNLIKVLNGGKGKHIHGASYCCNKFAFIGWDDSVYIIREDGTLWKKVYVDFIYSEGVSLLPDGFVACMWWCSYFDFNGNAKWTVKVRRSSKTLATHDGYVYVPDYDLYGLHIFRLSDGEEVKKIGCTEPATGVAICGNKLALVSVYRLYFYDMNNATELRELWRIEGLEYDPKRRTVFSSDCKYVATTNRKKLLIYDSRGNVVLKKDYGNAITAIAWHGDRIAVALATMEVHVYELSVENLKNVLYQLPRERSLVL